LSAHMQSGNPVFRGMLGGMTATMRSGGMDAMQASQHAYARMQLMLEQQAGALAFKDVVAELAIVVICLIPLAFIMQKPKKGPPGDGPPPH
jgi:hypothetical protein